MHASLSLIQLVSEQTMQNLLPVLRLRPARVIHLATEKTAGRSQPIVDAAGLAHHPVEHHAIRLSSMPSIAEACRAVRRAIAMEKAAGRQPVVNFTGGTKLMSIGAYDAARQDGVPSLYVDTQSSTFMDGETGPGLGEALEKDFSFTSILPSLTVRIIACANGCVRVTEGRDWRPFLPLADHLLNSNEDEEATHEAFQGPHGLFPNGREPTKPADWLPYLDRDITLPEKVRCLALEAGIVDPGGSAETVRLPSHTRAELEHLAAGTVADYHSRYFAAIAPVQQTISLLSGGWWEVILAARAEASGRFHDLRWSVQVGQTDGTVLEEDVVAVDGVQIAYISCKRGRNKARLLPLLEEIKSRATTLGGTFNRKFLAVRKPPGGKALLDLQTRAASLGIRLLFADDVRKKDAFG